MSCECQLYGSKPCLGCVVTVGRPLPQPRATKKKKYRIKDTNVSPGSVKCTYWDGCGRDPCNCHEGWDATGSPVSSLRSTQVPKREPVDNTGLELTYSMLSVPKCKDGYQVGHSYNYTVAAAGDKVDDEVTVQLVCRNCNFKATIFTPGKL